MIVVTGFNGSGTSAVTRFLVDMGIEFPGPYEAEENLENRLVREVNDAILRKLTTVPAVGPLMPEEIPDYERVMIDPSEYPEVPVINWKDPKACLTLPVWGDRVERVVWVKRCAAHVYRSLSEYVNWSVEQFHASLARYEEYLARSLRAFSIPYCVISYEDLYRYEDVGRARALVTFCRGQDEVDGAKILATLARMRKPRNF